MSEIGSGVDEQMTAFVAFLTLDAKRQEAGRMDWCCCFKSKKFLEEVK